MNKNNLNNIKVAIFDFDDTLAIHKDRDYSIHRRQSEEKFLGYYLTAYLNSDSFYETIEPCIISESIYNLIKILKSNNIKMYCVTGMKFSFHFKAKENFVHKHYDDGIEVISASSQELKVDAIKIIKQINNCDFNEILFVDDLKENINRFKELGIHALLPNNVDTLLIK